VHGNTAREVTRSRWGDGGGRRCDASLDAGMLSLSLSPSELLVAEML
jgi:hypothetical protein